MNEELPLLGFGLPVSGSWATPQNMLRIARRAEDLGYASLWTFQRVLRPAAGVLDPAYEAEHNPASRSADDASYQAVHDPLMPLAFVAGHTSRIGVGTATICAPFTAPAVLAKALTSLDVISAGRLTVGLGIGWLPQEFAAAGVPFDRRGERMDEYLRCLQSIWADDPVEFSGQFYNLPPSHIGPSPVQRPHPPILLGGAAPSALRRAGRLAQGWIASTREDLSSLPAQIETVREGARDAGRDPRTLRFLVRGVVELGRQAGRLRRPDGDPGREGPTDSRRLLHGTREQILEDLLDLRRSGVTEVFFDLNFSPRVVSAHVDAGEAVAYAELVLDTFAPAAPASV